MQSEVSLPPGFVAPVLTPAFDGAVDQYSVTADELRSFIERYEQLEAEKKDLSEQQKELKAEAKGRGYDVKIMLLIVKLRKLTPDAIAETEAVTELYKTALGMG